MSIPGKLLIALLCAAGAAALWANLIAELTFMQFLAPSAAAAVLAVVLSHRALPMPAAFTPASSETPQTTGEANRATGKSKKPASTKKKTGNARPADKTGKAKSTSPPKSKGRSKESGTVKWFNGTKGFGFIIRESGEEIFVHHRSIEGEGRRNLRDGAPVRFRVVETDKGPQAEDVEAVSG